MKKVSSLQFFPHQCESFPGAVKCNRCCNAEVQQPAATTENSHEVDEFGRSKKTKPKIIWPPPFEESGSAFVLDCRTGMFHEAKSDFFYDPKTKMYFCNSNRVYYTYKTETKRFREAENTSAAPDPTGNSSTDLVPIMDNSSVPEKNESKKTISIKLTTKTVAKQVEKVEDNEAALSRVAKKHAVDMAKWSVRQTEKRSKTAVATEMKLVRTAKGEPVCLVCRRKFKSVETLRLHEKSSQLHKTSLEKTQSMFESKYADRARQRRELHDEFDSSLIQSGSVASVQPKVDQQEDSAAASLQIGEAMLRKVGWTEDETHQGAPALRREWSRIEAIASNKKVGTSSQPLGLGIK